MSNFITKALKKYAAINKALPT